MESGIGARVKRKIGYIIILNSKLVKYYGLRTEEDIWWWYTRILKNLWNLMSRKKYDVYELLYNYIFEIREIGVL